MNDWRLLEQILREAGVTEEELEKAKQQAIKDIKKEMVKKPKK